MTEAKLRGAVVVGTRCLQIESSDVIVLADLGRAGVNEVGVAGAAEVGMDCAAEVGEASEPVGWRRSSLPLMIPAEVKPPLGIHSAFRANVAGIGTSAGSGGRLIRSASGVMHVSRS